MTRALLHLSQHQTTKGFGKWCHWELQNATFSVGKKNEESQNWKPKSSSLRCPQELLECQMTSGTGRMRGRLALRGHIVLLQNLPRHLCVLPLYVACLKLRRGCQTELSWFVCKRQDMLVGSHPIPDSTTGDKPPLHLQHESQMENKNFN